MKVSGRELLNRKKDPPPQPDYSNYIIFGLLGIIGALSLGIILFKLLAF